MFDIFNVKHFLEIRYRHYAKKQNSACKSRFYKQQSIYCTLNFNIWQLYYRLKVYGGERKKLHWVGLIGILSVLHTEVTGQNRHSKYTVDWYNLLVWSISLVNGIKILKFMGSTTLYDFSFNENNLPERGVQRHGLTNF